MERTGRLRKPRVFYGYWILTVAFFCNFVFSGAGFYSFGLFVKSLEVEFGWGRGEIMVAFTLFVLIQGVASPFIGRLVDRYGAKQVIAAGALVSGLGFILLSTMSSYWYLYSGYVITGVGVAAAGIIPATALVSNWFKKRRGTAIGIMSTGIGAGGTAIAPLVGGYLIPDLGWRAAYLILALLMWGLIPLALLVVKTEPAEMGLYPDGIASPETGNEVRVSSAAAEEPTLKMALVTSGFWLIAVSFMAGGFGQLGVLQHQFPYLEDIGFPPALAAGIVGGVGLGSLVGKFIFGWLCDRMPVKYAWCIGLALQFAGTMILMSVRLSSPAAVLWLYALIMGLGIGSWLPTMSMIISDNFGLTSYGAIFGMVTLMQSLGSAAGPLMAGYLYDAMNTYRWAFIIFLALYVVAAPTILAVRRRESL